jgi:hypothetical protein
MSPPVCAEELPGSDATCPECGSPDTARYKWPDDPQSRIFQMNHPDTRLCLECRCVWWTD